MLSVTLPARSPSPPDARRRGIRFGKSRRDAFLELCGHGIGQMIYVRRFQTPRRTTRCAGTLPERIPDPRKTKQEYDDRHQQIELDDIARLRYTQHKTNDEKYEA